MSAEESKLDAQVKSLGKKVKTMNITPAAPVKEEKYMEKVEQIKLTPEQQMVFDAIVKERCNVFVTSPGGCGKTTLIKYVFNHVKSMLNVGLTSLTGVSAVLIQGSTIHSFLGLGLATASYEVLSKKICKSSFYSNRWRKLDMLIVDEVSMMSLELFNKIEAIARDVRQNQRPFGGLQVVFSGDFLQLPCVNDEYFCFESAMWPIVFTKTFYLVKVIRQKDAQFVKILNEIRVGVVTDECKKILKSREIKYLARTGLIPTMLYSTNAKVDEINNIYYNKLIGEEHIYRLYYNWHSQTSNRELYESRVRLPPLIKLKVGAQVMHLVNVDGLCNGSRGVVTGFVEKYPVVSFNNGITRVINRTYIEFEEGDRIIMTYSQIPLKLAYAATIHKLQGSTLDLARIDFHKIFADGQAYVALSRVSSLEGLYLRNVDFNAVIVNPKALAYYRYLERTAITTSDTTSNDPLTQKQGKPEQGKPEQGKPINEPKKEKPGCLVQINVKPLDEASFDSADEADEDE